MQSSGAAKVSKVLHEPNEATAWVAHISVSLTLSQTPAYTARAQIQG